MKNQYMFFGEQNFENFDLTGYKKTDICIPQTNVHIYEFECLDSDTCNDALTKAEKLDRLTEKLTNKYKELFQVVNSESSQYFCGQIYPLIVSFETKLRYVLYISRSLYENGNVNKESYLLSIDKKEKPIEEIDFGKIYEAVFTDKDLQGKVKDLNSRKLTKADLIKEVQDIEEKTLWRQIVGSGYNYIENHFLEIIDYRNAVMHNHFMCYTEYENAKKIMQAAISELDRASSDKLIGNNSEYLNKVNIVDTLSGVIKTMEAVAKTVNENINVERVANIINMLALAGKILYKPWLLNDDETNLPDEQSADNS